MRSSTTDTGSLAYLERDTRLPRLSIDLRTAAERASKQFAQRFERTAGEVTRVEFQDPFA